MKRKQTRFFINFLTMGIIIVLITVMASCSSTSTSKTTTTTTTTPTKTPTKTLSSITVTPAAPANLAVGFTTQFIATAAYSDGSNADITSNVKWASSDTGIATISSAGLAAGVAAGTANITATFSSVTNPVVILTVVPAPALSSITVTPTTPDNLAVGSTQLFVAMGKYADGETMDITSKATWTSSDVNIATVSSAGVATGVAIGSTNITAALSGVTSPVVSLPVVAFTLSSITITPATPANLAVGLTEQLTATANYTDGTTADITSKVTWVSSDPNVATISSDGLAKGIGEGSTDITAALSGNTSAAVKLPVAILSSIAVSPASPNDLLVGALQRFVSVGTFSNGVVSMITAPVIWTSSNTSVATISSDGMVTGVAAGSTNITFTLSGLNSTAVTLNVVTTVSTTSP